LLVQKFLYIKASNPRPITHQILGFTQKCCKDLKLIMGVLSEKEEDLYVTIQVGILDIEV
jgi:hypothetical protein